MLWIKAFHLISIVCWFAALFYLPRLFVYHVLAEDQLGRDRFKIMERKLYRAIATPAMLATIIFGAILASANWDYYSTSTWFWIKMALVLALTAYHGMCGKYLRQLRQDCIQKSHVYFRWFNEFPVFILIAAVLLAVLKQPA